jgi:hypothetical protein
MGLYSCLQSALPQYDWWVWNVLEIVVRLFGILLSLACIFPSLMMSDSGSDFAVSMALLMASNFVLLTIALIIRNWKLGVITVSIPLAFIFICLPLSGPPGVMIFVLLLVIECLFGPVGSMYRSTFEQSSGLNAQSEMREYAPVDTDGYTA